MNDPLFQNVRRRIVLLDYAPGQVLREKDLIEEFSVSRTPVREALIRLEMEGLVRIIPHQGTFVTEVSFQSLKDVFEIRCALMRLAAQLAVARVTDGEIEAMRAHLRSMKAESGSRALMEADMAFHELFNRATKNRTLDRMLGTLRNQTMRIWAFLPESDDYYLELPQELDAVVDALERRDEAETIARLETHSKRFVEHVRAQL